MRKIENRHANAQFIEGIDRDQCANTLNNLGIGRAYIPRKEFLHTFAYSKPLRGTGNFI